MKSLYKKYEVIAAKLGKNKRPIPYTNYAELWTELHNELERLNIDAFQFLDFTLNYMTNIYPNTFFMRSGTQFKSIVRYLKQIQSGDEATKDQSKDLIQQYTSLYLLTSLSYNTLLIYDLETLDIEAYSGSIYELMLAYSPIIIAYKITHNELTLEIGRGKDKTYYDFILQGYFDKFFEYYENLRKLPKEQILEIYKDAYNKLDNLNDQITSIESSIYLMGTIGTGDFIF